MSEATKMGKIGLCPDWFLHIGRLRGRVITERNRGSSVDFHSSFYHASSFRPFFAMDTVFRLTCLLLKVNSVTFEYVPGTLTSPAIPYQSPMSLVCRPPLLRAQFPFYLFLGYTPSFPFLPSSSTQVVYLLQ